MTDATKALERALDVIRPLILSKPKVAITLAVLIAVLTVIGAGTVVAEVWGFAYRPILCSGSARTGRLLGMVRERLGREQSLLNAQRRSGHGLPGIPTVGR